MLGVCESALLHCCHKGIAGGEHRRDVLRVVGDAWFDFDVAPSHEFAREKLNADVGEFFMCVGDELVCVGGAGWVDDGV